MTTYRATGASTIWQTAYRTSVTIEQVRAVWGAVTRTPDAPMRQLAAETGINLSAVKVALDILEAAGYVKAYTTDGRRIRYRRVLVPLMVRV